MGIPRKKMRALLLIGLILAVTSAHSVDDLHDLGEASVVSQVNKILDKGPIGEGTSMTPSETAAHDVANSECVQRTEAEAATYCAGRDEANCFGSNKDWFCDMAKGEHCDADMKCRIINPKAKDDHQSAKCCDWTSGTSTCSFSKAKCDGIG